MKTELATTEFQGVELRARPPSIGDMWQAVKRLHKDVSPAVPRQNVTAMRRPA